MFDENVELAKSPSLEPSPVKSNRSTAMPLAASAAAIRFAASTSLPQVKQCANSAYAVGSPSGRSSAAASWWPPTPENWKRSIGIGVLLLYTMLTHQRRHGRA